MKIAQTGFYVCVNVIRFWQCVRIDAKGMPDVAAQQANVHGIKGRYARALFDLAQETGALETVESDLIAIEAMLAESADFRAFVMSPLHGRDAQARGIAAVGKLGGMGDLTLKFLGVLAANRRLSVLSDAIGAFRALLAVHRGEVSAEVTSARALTKKQIDALSKKLKAAVGRDVAIDARVDESLLGGLRVQIGSRMMDSSLKTKLQNLAIAMKGVQ